VNALDAFKHCTRTLWLACAGASVCTAAEVADDREAQMAAAYVFNFVKFVEWPQSALGEKLEVCFVGAADIRDALANSTLDKKAGSRSIIVRQAHGDQSLTGCEVIYIAGEARNVPTHQAALTIGESADFTREGGIIRLYTESNRLRFIVNVDNAKREGIQVSSNLLKLASQVEGGTR
jgi:hypothetical protein